MRKPTRLQLRKQIEKEVLNQMTLKEIKKIEKEVYPYFRHVIEEENTKLKAHLLMSGQFKLLEAMSKEEEKLLNEGILSTVADVGITVGQMVGGGVGQAAGIAGLVKYTPEFQNNIGKSFLEWFGPFISLFFSAQALFFPMPAVGSLKTILQGFVSGVKNLLTGAGGLAAKGVRIVFEKGSGFITTMIDLFKKAALGIGKAIGKGGDDVAKIEAKLGGSGKLSSMFKSLKGAIEEFVKRLGVIKEGIKHYGAKMSPTNIKDILSRAFQTSKDKIDDGVAYYRGAKTAAAAEGKSLASHMTKKGITAAKNKFSSVVGSSFKKINEWLVSFMTKNPELLSKFVGKKMVSDTGLTYVFKGMDDAGKFILETNKQGVKAAREIVKQNKAALSTQKSTLKASVKSTASAADDTLKNLLKKQGSAKKALKRKYRQKIAAKKKTLDYQNASKTRQKEMLQKINGEQIKKVAELNKAHAAAAKQLKDLGKVSVKNRKSYVATQSAKATEKTAAANAAAMAKGEKEFADASISAAQFFSVYGHMWFGVAKTGVKKATGVAMPEFDQFLIYLAHLYPPKQAAVDIARIVAASQGGGFDEEYMDDYVAGKTASEKEIERIKSKEKVNERRENLYLSDLLWEAKIRRRMINSQKIIRLIN